MDSLDFESRITRILQIDAFAARITRIN